LGKEEAAYQLHWLHNMMEGDLMKEDEIEEKFSFWFALHFFFRFD
jgi:hypothetical protein